MLKVMIIDLFLSSSSRHLLSDFPLVSANAPKFRDRRLKVLP
jgi:hypothetical protein